MHLSLCQRKKLRLLYGENMKWQTPNVGNAQGERTAQEWICKLMIN